MPSRLTFLCLAFGLALGTGCYLGFTAGGTPARRPVRAREGGLHVAGTSARPAPPPTLASPPAPGLRAVDLAAGLPDPSQGVNHLNLSQTLAELKRLETSPAGVDVEAVRKALVTRLAMLDPGKALSYVDTLSGEEHGRQKVNVYAVWAGRDPEAAAAHFTQGELGGGLASDESRESAATLARAWARRDPAQALAWVKTLPEEARGSAVDAVISSMAASDPRQALQAALGLGQSYEQAEALRPLAQEWARQNPEAASAWVTTLEDPASQSQAAQGLVTAWMTQDAQAASVWVAGLPAGRTRDVAVAAMVQAQAARQDPGSAARWAATIQDEVLRQQVLPQLVQRWQVHDPAAAQAWLATGR